ncbi:MEMO1 family protein [Methanooceanicella nereidis]|nr:MEMO1 family protein [Methanocella sp. CWC-04]
MRRPAVAGQFYPGNENDLRELIKKLAPEHTPSKIPALGVVAPHAGYIYSGRVAAEVYASIEEAPTFVILGPNHYMYGSAVALSTQEWMTPLGNVQVDEDFIDCLPIGIIDKDELAHRSEHSIEVQIPFLQYFFKDFKIVPIALGLQDYDTIKELAGELVKAIEKYDERVVIIASSDFTHYEDVDVAHRKDRALIKTIEQLDVPAFYDELYRINASTCGYGPIGAMMMACRERGAKYGKLLRYATSGDVTGDRQVVGYAGIAVY